MSLCALGGSDETRAPGSEDKPEAVERPDISKDLILPLWLWRQCVSPHTEFNGTLWQICINMIVISKQK